MKLKKIFKTSSSSKEILDTIHEAYKIYLKKYQCNPVAALLISGGGTGDVLEYELVCRYEEDQQFEVNRLAEIIEGL